MSQTEIKLDCCSDDINFSVVAFIEPGRLLNARVKPGDDLELIYNGGHVSFARVLSCSVGDIADVPEEIFAYNQDAKGRSQNDLRNCLGVDLSAAFEITVVLLDVSTAPQGVVPDEDELIGAMGDRLRSEDVPGPKELRDAASKAGLFYAEDQDRDRHFSDEHEELDLTISPTSLRPDRPDKDDELVESEAEEYDEDYDDDMDDYDDDSELDDLLFGKEQD